VPGENLTRAEARARAKNITVRSYDISIDLSDAQSAETFRTVTTVSFLADEGSSTFIDAITSRVHSITLNGVSVDVSAADGARIQLDQLQTQNTLVVDADFSFTNTGEGLHKFVDPVDGEVYLYTQFEVPDSRRVFAVFEQPDLKATFAFTITAPNSWQVVSNQPTPEPRSAGDTNVFEFSATPRISSYITALIAGPYTVVRDELVSSNGKTVPLGVFARASMFDYLDADYIFDITKKGFAYFEKRFGMAYPFDKYDQLFVPEFNAGAMENAGAVTFTETYVFRSKVSDAIRERRVVTILHELAHMWFGDLVTMRWWNDLWLNESFAEWASTIATAEATEWTEAWTTFLAMEKSWAYRQDQLPSTHPVVATINDLEDVQVNFDGITYAKGGSVLKQLVAWVGEDAFFAGVQNYFKTHQWSNTELADLLAELEKTSGRDLTSWSKKWLETAGVNTLRPVVDTDADGVITSFAIAQSAPEDWPTLRPHRLAIGIYLRNGETVSRVHRVECDIDGELTDIPQMVGLHRGDAIVLNDDDLAYAKIRLDESSMSFALDNLSQFESPLTRALVWGAAWDATRDAEMPARDYRALILRNLDSETESTTIRTVLGQLSLVTKIYAAPDTVDAAQKDVADTLWRWSTEAAPGSDQQFQFVKAFAALACDSSHAELLSGLLEGSQSVPGLTLDTDLEWELLGGLVLLGKAGEKEIDQRLASDNTSNGAQAAARIRAMRPTPEAKREVFDELTSSTELPNLIIRSATMGYNHVNNPNLLDGLVEPYFEALLPIWESRTYKIAEYLVEGLYPVALVNDHIHTATENWLDTSDAPPALRRMVEENLAGVLRAKKAQELDATAG
jgi:aminopeptidase N